jgi:hypothetical protein
MIDLIPEHLRASVVRALAHLLRVELPPDEMRVTGIIKIREYPLGASLEDWLAWWPLLTEQERDRYTLYEHHNTITNSGRTQALTYLSASTATVQGWAQYFAVGTLATNTVGAGDTVLGNEIYRQVPTTTTVTGTQVDIATVIGTNTAPGVYTNGGLYGVTATGSANSGTLVTHSLMNYTKVNGVPVVADYLINLT